jgi:hypothetical protein
LFFEIPLYIAVRTRDLRAPVIRYIRFYFLPAGALPFFRALKKRVNIEPFPKLSGLDNKIPDHPRGGQTEDGGE